MAKSKTKLSAFSRFSKSQLIIAGIFILGFGGFGVWKLAFSSAARPSKVILKTQGINFANESYKTGIDPYLNEPVQDLTDEGGGVQITSEKLRPNSGLWYTRGVGAGYDPTKRWDNWTGLQELCYHLRAPDGDVSATITAGVNKADITILMDVTYKRYCLTFTPTSTTSPGYAYDVQNNSNNVLYVYEQVLVSY